MKLTVSRIDMWAAGIKDRPGGLSEKLAALSEAGASLEFVMARRAPERPGKGVVFLAPVKGARQIRTAKKAGFHKTKSLHAVRIEGPDKPGLGTGLTEELAAADINVRGLSAAVVGKRFVLHLALDSAADATKASRLLRRLS